MNTPKIRIYIAGPMSGYPDLNWDAFDEKEKQLTSAGFEVVNPARMDREIGLDPERCDAIYLMNNFQFSKGACWERALAKHWNLKRYYEIPRHDHEVQDFGPYGRYREIKSAQLEFEFSDPISEGYSMKNSHNWEHP